MIHNHQIRTFRHLKSPNKYENMSVCSHCKFQFCYFTTLRVKLAIIVKLYNDLTIRSNENGLIRTRSCIQQKNRFLIRFASIRIAWTSKWAIILKKVSQYKKVQRFFVLSKPDMGNQHMRYQKTQDIVDERVCHFCN